MNISESKKLLSVDNRPLIISGPCSAESREQVLETARRLFRTGKVDVIRAGIWKPRTRPGNFEGIGVQGLAWMQEAKEICGLPVTVEVAKASHVELCLEFNIDILWIGARTAVNPFAVQEIANALKGVDIPVMVKNPINPDLELWLGGIERLKAVGVQEIAAIHRGFSKVGEKYYRNRPEWQIAIEFMNRMPDIPLICDPSHICGRRDILHEVSQKAMDLDYHGLMIESHIDPDNAWSDPKQQLTPEALGDLIDRIVFREDHEDDVPMQRQLQYLRQEIDHIDDELLHLLADRMKVARQIGEYKKEHNMTILQQKRWNEIVGKSKTYAKTHELSQDFVMRYLESVHEESIDQQERVMNA
jgi:chorismate mutase